MASLAPAAAQDPHAEIFTGLDASNNAVSGYLGAGYAFGKGRYAPGWRVRAVGSLGSYGTLFGGGSDLGATFNGDASYGAALLGYQLRADTLIVKLFAQVEAEDQRISPRDPDNAVQGSAIGLKLVAESWLDLATVVPLSRRGLWHGVSAILEPRARRSALRTASLARARRRSARQRGIQHRPRRRIRAGGFARRRIDPLRRLHRQFSRRRTERLLSISKTNRAATCRSASIAPSEIG